jgi:hypothetical protein
MRDGAVRRPTLKYLAHSFRSSERYQIASVKCAAWIASALVRSASVRAIRINAVVRPRRQPQRLHRRLYQRQARPVKGAEPGAARIGGERYNRARVRDRVILHGARDCDSWTSKNASFW